MLFPAFLNIHCAKQVCDHAITTVSEQGVCVAAYIESTVPSYRWELRLLTSSREEIRVCTSQLLSTR